MTAQTLAACSGLSAIFLWEIFSAIVGRSRCTCYCHFGATAVAGEGGGLSITLIVLVVAASVVALWIRYEGNSGPARTGYRLTTGHEDTGAISPSWPLAHPTASRVRRRGVYGVGDLDA